MYRIYTEDKDKPAVERILDSYFQGYTVTEADGVWQGTHEASLTIDVETPDASAVQAATTAIKVHNNQQAVLVENITSQPELI